MWVVRTENLGRQYDNGHWGLQDVTASFDVGRIVGLLGPNGSGKSTFLNLLCAALRPTSGTIRWNPRVQGRRIGWCSQYRSLDWYLTAHDNVLLGARLAGLPVAESHRQAAAALALVGLAAHAKSFADMLSGGQQQRVQIARALVANPSVLLLDEPTAGLDVESAEQLMTGLQERAAAGATILLSSHDLGLIESRCDQIVLLDQGRVVAFEARDRFLERFAGADVLEIVYEGTLAPAVLADLASRVEQIVNHTPLRLMVRRDVPVADLLRLVEGNARIVDIKRSQPGLREAYLTFARRDRGTTQGGGR